MKRSFAKIFAVATFLTINLLFLNLGSPTVTSLPATGSVDLPLDSFTSSGGFTLSATDPRTWGYYQPGGYVE